MLIGKTIFICCFEVDRKMQLTWNHFIVKTFRSLKKISAERNSIRLFIGDKIKTWDLSNQSECKYLHGSNETIIFFLQFSSPLSIRLILQTFLVQ